MYISDGMLATHMEPDITIDATIITPVEVALEGKGLIGIDIRSTYFEGVLASKVQGFGDVERERRIAFIQMLAHLLTIHIDDGIVVNSLEMEAHRLTLHIGSNGQDAFVYSLASIILEPFHNIIGMGHIDGLPMMVIC